MRRIARCTPIENGRVEPGIQGSSERLLDAWRFPRRFGLYLALDHRQGEIITEVLGGSGNLNLGTQFETRLCHEFTVLLRESH